MSNRDIFGKRIYGGIEYRSEEYHEAMEKCELIFNERFCKNDMKETRVSCLDFFESDAFINGKVEYGKKDYCLGKCDPNIDNIMIGIFSDGKNCWFSHPRESEIEVHDHYKFGENIEEYVL